MERHMKSYLYSCFVFFSFFILQTQAQAHVWPTQNQWSPDWENRYSEWVKNNWDENFFLKPNTPYTNLKLDCADVVFSMRAIFAYENRLPFAVQDTTNTSKIRLISNQMKAFDRLPITDDEMPGYEFGPRMRAFLIYLFNTQGTFSIPYNTYPAAINRQSVRPGSLILTDRESHHSWTIKDILPIGIPHLIYNSRPASTQLKKVTYLPSMEFTFKDYKRGDSPDYTRNAGFRNFRKIEDIGKPAWKIQDPDEPPQSGFSDVSYDQYQFNYNQYRREIQKRLALVEETPDQQLKRILETSCQLAKERVAAVQEGLVFRESLADNQCMSDADYDNFSTPNRDLRLRNTFEELAEAYKGLSWGFLSDTQLIQHLQDVIDNAPKYKNMNTQNRYCAFEFAPGRWMSLNGAYRFSTQKLFSSNPYDDLNWRWGLKNNSPQDPRSNPNSPTYCPSP
jgi:hypothetical protein